MKDPVNIFRLTEVDARLTEAVARLVPQLSASMALPSQERLRRIAASPWSVLFYAEAEGVVAGMLSLGWYDVPSGRCAWIEDVVVDAAFRGRGVGRALVAAGLAEAERIGADKVSLTSSAARTAAHALYLDAGFERYETELFRLKK